MRHIISLGYKCRRDSMRDTRKIIMKFLCTICEIRIVFFTLEKYNKNRR